MQRNAFILASLALIGCGDKGGEGDGTGTDTDGSCGVEISETVPADGATSQYYRMAYEVHLSDPDSTLSVSLVDASGTDVPGSLSWNDEGDVAYFTPTTPLASNATYTANIDYCSGAPATSFTTGELGAALTAELTGKAYVVDLATARFVKPEGVADLLLGQLENNILLGVDGETETELLMIGAISETGNNNQDYCNPTIDFPTADFSQSPFFSVGPQDTNLSIAGYTVPINQLEVSGDFAPDGSYFGGGKLAGEIDARDIAPLLGELLDTEDPDYVCELVAGFGVPCEACGSDGQNYCLSIIADQIVATELGTAIECVAGSDCNANCAENAAECDTSNYPTCD